MMQANGGLFSERLTSCRTEVLFIGLAMLFLMLFIWQTQGAWAGGWSAVFLVFCAFFIFYALNYRALIIRLDRARLTLRFGLFTWRIPVGNIAACRTDLASLWRIGGAGIHFTFLDGRYRAMFNFLEYPRVVITLKAKMGPVQEVAFSTRQPEKIMRLVQVLCAGETP